MKVLKRILGVLGTGYTALVVTVLAVRPGEWKDNLNEWGIILGLPLVFAAGIGSVLLVQWRNSRREMEPGNAENVNGADFSLITQRAYQQEAASLLQDDGARKVVKVFGYTGGTVILDVLGDDPQCQRHLEVRLLHRNWLVERNDETRHNARFPYAPRPWNKAEEIQDMMTKSLNQRIRRTFKYYDHQPCIKGMIITSRSTGEKTLFLSFFKWKEPPEDGGSVFKGSDRPFVRVRGTGELAKRFIDGIESQFDYEWRHSARPEEIEPLPETAS